MKQLFITIIFITLTGCAGMVDYATDALKDMQDTSRYETVREVAKDLCDTSNYKLFVNIFGKESVDKLITEACNPVTRKKNL